MDDNISNAIKRLSQIIETIPDKLRTIPIDKLTYKPEVGKWSKVEIIGHLIDSATNNHQRFIKAQYEVVPHLVYDQDKWSEYSFHQTNDPDLLIDMWAMYNRYLLHIIRNVENDKLSSLSTIGSSQPVTLEFLIEDYVRHMEHHLQQILDGM